MIYSQSPAAFLQRAGLRETSRKPNPTLRTDYMSDRRPLSYPLPKPQYSRHESGSPVPDRVTTTIWPHGGAPS